MANPHFAVTISMDVSNAYKDSRVSGIPFFVRYLHDCMIAINSNENMRLRVFENEVVDFEIIHASATILRPDKTFGCSFIKFDPSIEVFRLNFEKEKERIFKTDDLFPPHNGLDCIHCSALPWLAFSGHKEPDPGVPDSVPKLAFSKTFMQADKMLMNVSISVNHALVDGYHLGLFVEDFQNALNCRT